MKELLLHAGFRETALGSLLLENDRFVVKAFLNGAGWNYEWRSVAENCGGGPNQLSNITQIVFFL